MKLYLSGHQERYAVEQLQMQLFGGEKTEFVTEPFTGDGAVSALHTGAVYLTATAQITLRGRTGRGVSRVKKDEADVRGTRRILQRSYYLAAVQVLGFRPPWGALSGVRPSKLSTRCLMEGGTRRQAEKLMRQTFFVSPERSRLCVDASMQTVHAAGLLEPNDLSVYIGIPFCPTRCAYCSFVSQSIERFGAYLPEYLECLLREVRRTGELLRDSGFSVRTMYMGGGTPTTLSADQMRRLLDALHDAFDLSRCLEFTVEAGRPDTIDPEKLRVIRQGGATRISINPQTMSDRVLAAVGRRHTSEQTREAFAQAKEAGFEDINMDLIAGLPTDTAEGFLSSVMQVLALGPSNVTVHTLAIKKGAELSGASRELPAQQEVARMVDGAAELLRAADFSPYYLYRQKYMSGSFENTGWCRPGYPGLYNIYMMEELHSILSLGGGGMNKINLPGEALTRFHNPKVPQDYIARIEELLRRKEELFSLLAKTREA